MGTAVAVPPGGINNQNFIMADDRSNTWWQQGNGRAILGPLKGRQLRLVPADIVSFQTWRAEHPAGRVLAPDPAVEQRDGDYLATTWEREMATFKTVTPLPKKTPFTARQLVVGVKADGLAKAWSLDDLKKARVQLDVLGSTPLMIVSVTTASRSVSSIGASTAASRSSPPSSGRALKVSTHRAPAPQAPGARALVRGCGDGLRVGFRRPGRLGPPSRDARSRASRTSSSTGSTGRRTIREPSCTGRGIP